VRAFIEGICNAPKHQVLAATTKVTPLKIEELQCNFLYSHNTETNPHEKHVLAQTR